MRLFKKLPLAMALSFVGATLSMSGLVVANDEKYEIHTIEIEATANEQANIMIDIDGEMTEFTVPKSVLGDPEQLSELLIDVPAKVKDQLLTSLSSLAIDARHIKVKGHSPDDENIVIVEIDDEIDDELEEGDSRTIHKMVKKFHHNNIVIEHGGKIAVDSLIKMLSHRDFSVEELNKLQKALDEKR